MTRTVRYEVESCVPRSGICLWARCHFVLDFDTFSTPREARAAIDRELAERPRHQTRFRVVKTVRRPVWRSTRVAVGRRAVRP
jgi:hypothetical protein